MNFNVLVEPENGHFVAQVVGLPSLRAEGRSSEEATKSLIASLRHRMKEGQLFSVVVEPEAETQMPITNGPKPVFYEFKPNSIRELAGIFKDDPDLMQICEDIYRERDEEKRREFPE